MKQRFDIQDMPIFWREAAKPEPVKGIPSRMAIELMGPQSWGGISLCASKKLMEALEKIYRENENIGYLQEDNPLAEIYAPEYIFFIEKHLKKGAHINEIGAGGCYSLKRLKHLGFQVSAIDPSPVTLEASKKLGIDIVQDFFPPANELKLPKIDAFIHYDVLEHVVSPEAFLTSIYDNLSVGGKTLFVVPDSTLHIKEADLSMCLHQHLNYFSETSLRHLVTKVGFKIDELYRSKTTGTIYCCATKPQSLQHTNPTVIKLLKSAEEETTSFFYKAEINYHATVKTLSQLFEKNGGQKLAFYPPLRAVPFLAPIIDEYKERIVFVDDNTKVQSCFICDLDCQIMSREDAINEGVRNFIICSKPFKKALTGKLSEEATGLNIRLYYLDQLSREETGYDY